MTTKSGSGPSIARLCAAAIFSRLSLARRLALALPMAPNDSECFAVAVVGCCPLVACGPAGSCSSNLVEGRFCELRHNGVLRSSLPARPKTGPWGDAPPSRVCYRVHKRSRGDARRERRGEGMRRVALMLAAMALALLLASGVALAVNKVGTNGPDTLRGTNGDDNLLGKGGSNDELFSLNGRDNLLGGAGKDCLICATRQRRGFAGHKNLVGGPGNDYVLAGKGSDNVVGGEGNESG